MKELIERLEKATGYDRDLNGEIAVMEGLYARKPVVATPPNYTDSIDAAMTLIPDDWWLTIDRYVVSDQPEPQSYKWRVWLKRLEGDLEADDGDVSINKLFAHAPNIPIALCIVALKARGSAAIQPTDGD